MIDGGSLDDGNNKGKSHSKKIKKNIVGQMDTNNLYREGELEINVGFNDVMDDENEDEQGNIEVDQIPTV